MLIKTAALNRRRGTVEAATGQESKIGSTSKESQGAAIMRAVPNVRALLFALTMMFCMSAASFGQVAVGVSVNFGPPDLPVYEQPVCPGDDYIWTPGYWAWDGDDYYWVPGTWVLAPQPGFFWTPAYWYWGGSGFLFREGYWGPVVGFYGGINYGYGYFGHGYEGGRWDRGHFFYNRSVNNVNVTVVHNVYNTTIVNRNETRVSYNGGNGGIDARPSRKEEAAGRERHIPPVAAQMQHVQAARSNQEFRASLNHGKPAVAATPRPGDFRGRGVVAAREGGALHAPERNNSSRPNNADRPNNANRPSNAGRPPFHANEIPRSNRPPAPNTGNPKLDQKYQQQQEKLQQKQDQERQKLQQRQDQEHQRVAQQQANDARRQQMEQRHQQQTQQMMQKHEQQQQHLQQRQQPPPQQHAAPPPKGRP
jgi:WXXGXW repeat (2 copies)